MSRNYIFMRIIWYFRNMQFSVNIDKYNVVYNMLDSELTIIMGK